VERHEELKRHEAAGRSVDLQRVQASVS